MERELVLLGKRGEVASISQQELDLGLLGLAAEECACRLHTQTLRRRIRRSKSHVAERFDPAFRMFVDADEARARLPWKCVEPAGIGAAWSTCCSPTATPTRHGRSRHPAARVS
jgi:hypothetical protein